MAFPQLRYYTSRTFATVFTVLFTPFCWAIVARFIGLGSYLQLALSLLIGAIAGAGLWFGFARGTYITVDQNNRSVYNTFFFIRRDAIPFSQIVSLGARHVLTQAGTTSVWITFYSKDGRLKTRSFANRQAMKEVEFDNLIEKIHELSPRIEIADELLK